MRCFWGNLGKNSKSKEIHICIQKIISQQNYFVVMLQNNLKLFFLFPFRYSLSLSCKVKETNQLTAMASEPMAMQPAKMGGASGYINRRRFVSFTLHKPFTCCYNCVIEKGFSKGEKGIFPCLQYSFPYLRESRLRK